MKDTIQVSKENYLKAILEAEAEGHQVIPAMLAHRLEVSAPAVTMALKRLKRDGYVTVEPDGIVRLTGQGRETAYRTALRHHLIERMLSEVFGMEWYEVHEEAERLEHAVSPAFEEKLREKLGESGACPHGNAVLPESPDERKRRGEVPLSEAAEGRRYTVASLQERDPRLLLFLHQAGIGPGQRLRVASQNYDQTVSIELEAGSSILGRPAAEAVWLTPNKEQDPSRDQEPGIKMNPAGSLENPATHSKVRPKQPFPA
jgi:DtxR family transcriptional regulator, Mn-dependent transcriptional regulator